MPVYDSPAIRSTETAPFAVYPTEARRRIHIMAKPEQREQ